MASFCLVEVSSLSDCYIWNDFSGESVKEGLLRREQSLAAPAFVRYDNEPLDNNEGLPGVSGAVRAELISRVIGFSFPVKFAKLVSTLTFTYNQ